MAQFNLQPPEQFDFKRPNEWTRWKKRFEQFRIASGLSADTAERQISTLLYCLGEEAEAVLSSTNPADADRKAYDKVLGKFDAFFKVRKNILSSNGLDSTKETSWKERVPRAVMHTFT
jgi:hypothetical protein